MSAVSGSRAVAAPSFEDLLARRDLAWMGQNTTHLPLPPEVVEALTTSIAAQEYQLYAPAPGFSELRELILDDLGLPDARAWVTNGAVDGLHQVVTSLAPRLSRVVTGDPGWPWPTRFASIAGVPTATVPIYDEAVGHKLTARALDEHLVTGSLLYLVDPLNPLGSRYTRAELEALVELAREREVLIVHDCTYRHFATDHTLVADLYPERTVTTYSFSKWLGLAGLRVGAIVAAPQLLEEITRVPGNPLGSSITAQRAAIAGLRVREPWLATLREVNGENLRLVEDTVARTGFGSIVVPHSHGNFTAVDISVTGWSSEEVCAALLERNVFIRPGTYQSPLFGERFVKVSTSVPRPWAERFATAWAGLEIRDGASESTERAR
ncbi:pyridoxal phosphate-dependent aminotransferase [Pseudactinotalea sp.]|uniref:pyridoxal phosphate-dependent aminotransferase n=1 Tax=Pseudactinotalea sp. TaxID=1926260 RepID=UPI003B3B66B9